MAQPGPPSKVWPWVRDIALPYVGDDCLAWPFSRNRQGYAAGVSYEDRRPLAHTLICELAHGARPSPRHQASHRCGNGRGGCVSPRHLRWLTVEANNAEKLEHGTQPLGERNHKSKLTSRDVDFIRAAKDTTQAALASKFGVDQSTISDVLTGRSWNHQESNRGA